jgi:hypothetical protein
MNNLKNNYSSTRVVEIFKIKIGLNEIIFHTLIFNIAIHVATWSG